MRREETQIAPNRITCEGWTWDIAVAIGKDEVIPGLDEIYVSAGEC